MSLAHYLQKYGVACDCYDILLGPEYDLADDIVWETLLSKIRTGLYSFIFASFPCKSAALSRHGLSDRPGPGPLRSIDKPWGLPGLKPADKELVRLGNLHATRSATACREVMAAGGKGFALEQPAPIEGYPSLFHLPPLALDDLHASDAIFDQCMFGAASTKLTLIRYVGASFAELDGIQCTHEATQWQDSSGSYTAPHQRIAGRKLDDGSWATSAAENYSDEFNAKLACLIAAVFLGSNGDPASSSSSLP